MQLSVLESILMGMAPVTAKAPATASTAVKQFTPQAAGYDNPFSQATQGQSSFVPNTMGINRPLKEPAFLGYWNDKALFGGSRLYLEY